MITPLSELSVEEISTGNFCFEKTQEKFSKDPSKFLFTSPIKYNKKPLVITFDAFLASDRVLVSNFSSGADVFSLPIDFDDEDNISKIAHLYTELGELLQDDEEWTFTDLVRDDKIYLKLKFARNQKTPAFTTNLALNPKKIQDTLIYQGQKVTVTGAINFYVNFENKTAGITLTLRKLTIEAEENELPTTPKRKAEEGPRKKKRLALADVSNEFAVSP